MPLVLMLSAPLPLTVTFTALVIAVALFQLNPPDPLIVRFVLPSNCPLTTSTPRLTAVSPV